MTIIFLSGMAGMSPSGMLDPAAAKGETRHMTIEMQNTAGFFVHLTTSLLIL